MIRLVLFALLIAVPIAEIAVFLVVGSMIGVLPTILIIIGTAALGAYLLKKQGMAAFARLQADMQAKRMPAAAIGHALTVGIAGVLLLTPGFITDAFGFLLFIPNVRRALWARIAGSVRIHQPGSGRAGGGPFEGGARRPRTHGRTIELDADDYRSGGSGAQDSPWREGQ